MDIGVVSFTLLYSEVIVWNLACTKHNTVTSAKNCAKQYFFSLSLTSKNGIVIINLVTKIPDNKCTSKGVFLFPALCGSVACKHTPESQLTLIFQPLYYSICGSTWRHSKSFYYLILPTLLLLLLRGRLICSIKKPMCHLEKYCRMTINVRERGGAAFAQKSSYNLRTCAAAAERDT